MDTKFAIILLCLVLTSSSQPAQATQLTTPSEPTGQVINSPTNPQQQRYGIGFPIDNQNQPILGQPNQPPLTGTGFNQPIIGQQSASSSVNQPLTGFNPSALNQPFPNRLNHNTLTGNSIPFLNGNSKLEVKIVSISIALLLAFYGTGRN